MENTSMNDPEPMTPLILTPAERQYLLRLLGGSLDGECGLTAEGVLVLRGKLENFDG